MFLQSHYNDPKKVREMMRRSIRGEISRTP